VFDPVPAHPPTSHDPVSIDPTVPTKHSAPPNCGRGFAQVRSRVCVPTPHVVLHTQAFHSDHWPSTVKQNKSYCTFQKYLSVLVRVCMLACVFVVGDMCIRCCNIPTYVWIYELIDNPELLINHNSQTMYKVF
jgi:hypothetical protein